MTGTSAEPGQDPAASALALRLFAGMLATQESFAAYLGVKLGLYQALHDGGQATSGQLAERAGLAPRYVREWLEQQAAAGLIDVADTRPAADQRQYRLSPGHARVLTSSADPASAVWTALLPLGGIAAALPALLDAFRTGAGVPAEAFGADWRQGHGGANRAIYTRQLGGWIRANLPDVDQRLRADGAAIADVGCGEGWSSIAMARAYPAARVTAVDCDADSIAAAASRAAQEDAGIATRTEFRHADAASLATRAERYDLVCVFDVLHELARPVPVLAACRQICRPGGGVLVIESAVGAAFRAPASELERFQYATSVLHCLPAGLVGEQAAGTGTVMRPAVIRGYAREAGFSGVASFEVDDRFHRLYRLLV